MSAPRPFDPEYVPPGADVTDPVPENTPATKPSEAEVLSVALGELDTALPGAFWQIAKGRLRADERLFAAVILFGEEEIGLGESTSSAGDALLVAISDALSSLQRPRPGSWRPAQ